MSTLLSGILLGALLGLGTAWWSFRRRPPPARAVEVEGVLRDALDRMQLGVTVCDADGRILYANPALERMHGYEPGELLGEPGHVLGAPTARRTLTESDHQTRTKWRRETLNQRKDGDTFPVALTSNVLNDDAGQMIGVVTICEDISDQKKAEEAEKKEALRDVLTGLASRGFFLQLVQRVIERQKRHKDRRFAVVYMDLHRFKLVNESLGHEAGDALLAGVAERLVACVRPSDVVARIAGDEFAILLDDLHDERGGVQVAQRILQEFKTPFQVEGREIFAIPSIGIALSDSHHRSAEHYLADAVAAMNRAASRGEGQYEIFDRKVHQRATQRLKLETDLRRAVDQDEFRVLYQPIIDLQTELVVGFEALVRWHHGERGVVGPGEFIPIAEQTGLIVPIGQEVLRAATSTVATWRKRFTALEQLGVNVNFSAKHLQRGDVVQEILATLAESGLEPEHLKVEITETLLMDDAESQIRMINGLREAGMGVAIDDFGTGYSSLSYLRRFQIDTLKIDRAFVSGAGSDDAWDIVEMIIGLARGMGVTVVAEGVETEGQKTRLRDLGCDLGQGYLFGRPLEPDVAATMLETQEQFRNLERRHTAPRRFDVDG